MKKHIIRLSLLAFSLGMLSCEDEATSNGDLNADIAKAELNALASQASADVTRLTESEGVSGAIDLLYLLEDFDFSARKSYEEGVREQLHLIAQYFVYGPSSRVSDDEKPFSFDDIKGLYEWNSETESFDESASDFFIVLFPTEGSITNNAELKISSLDLIHITENIDGYIDEYQVPTDIEAYLKVDGELMVSLDFTAEWTETGFPRKADVELLVSPFTFVLGFDNTFPKSSSLVTSVQLDGEVIIGADVDVEFATERKEEPAILDGFVQYYNLKVSGNVDVPTAEEENSDLNDFINLELLLEGEKIGDIIFENDEAYVLYSDGSRELLEEILEPVLADIEDLINDFEEDFD